MYSLLVDFTFCSFCQQHLDIRSAYRGHPIAEMWLEALYWEVVRQDNSSLRLNRPCILLLNIIHLCMQVETAEVLPTLLVTREVQEHANVFHTLTDLMNVYISLRMLGMQHHPRCTLPLLFILSCPVIVPKSDVMQTHVRVEYQGHLLKRLRPALLAYRRCLPMEQSCSLQQQIQ